MPPEAGGGAGKSGFSAMPGLANRPEPQAGNAIDEAGNAEIYAIITLTYG
jgi:hypothetical protein